MLYPINGMFYPISEIFYSIQGEGFHAGTPVVFIRLSGCNLNCPWCDTKHTEYDLLSVDAIMGRISKWPDAPIVITGGEPTIHDLTELLAALQKDERYVAMETNGINAEIISDWWGMQLLDWITFSPKTFPISQNQKDLITCADEIKVVLAEDNDPALYLKWLDEQGELEEGRLFIQPCSENFQPAVDYVLAHPEWRLSIQIQKVIGVR